MPQSSLNFMRALAGICLAVGLSAWGSSARAQTLPPGALWTPNGDKMSVCQNPSSQEAIGNCFSDVTYPGGSYPTTDGVNVYFVSTTTGVGYSCPVSQLGGSCKKIRVGPFGGNNFSLTSLYASVEYPGYTWHAENENCGDCNYPQNFIWRCPVVDWQEGQSGASIGCEQIDYSGNRRINALVINNGWLYAGLDREANRLNDSTGLIWRCSPMGKNDCSNFNTPSNGSEVIDLAAGAGFLWAALTKYDGKNGKGHLWRCDLETPDSCNSAAIDDNTDFYSLAYDGQGTLFLGTKNYLESCDTYYGNCKTKIDKTWTSWKELVAYSGDVFGVAEKTVDKQTVQGTFYGAQQYSQAAAQNKLSLIYIPSGGVGTLGSARVQVPLTGVAAQLRKVCEGNGSLTTKLAVRGFYSRIDRTVDLCKTRDGQPRELTFSALDPGWYSVSANLGRYSASKTIYVRKDMKVTDVSLKLRRRKSN